MERLRFPKACWWLSGAYFLFSNFVYFASMGSQSHAWWPVFLAPLAIPVFLIDMTIGEGLFALLAGPSPAITAYANYDYFVGACYIILGSLWMWFVGRGISRATTYLFPLKEAH